MAQNQNEKFDLKYCHSLGKEVIIRGKVEYDIEEMKKYFSKFIYSLNTAEYLLKEGLKTRIYTKQQLKQLCLDPLPKPMSEWFFKQCLDRYEVICDPKKPKLGPDFINVFGGFRHERRAYKSYPEEIKQKVELFLTYMKETLASGKEANYNFMLKWYANAVQLNKNQSVLYLKGPEGIGKSTITELFRDFILCLESYRTGKKKYLVSNYNKPLMGALLVVFEELPVSSQAEWESVSANIKNMVTSDYEDYEDKYEKVLPNVRNLMNMVINTNVEAIQHSEGRRYYIADISTQRQGDLEYWKNLHKQCFNLEVGSAIYNYLCEIDVSDFNSQDFPDTDAKMAAIVERLPYEYRFLKDQFIYAEQSIKKVPVSQLYQQYVTYMKSADKKPSSKFKFTAMLKDVNINYSHSGSVNYYDVPLTKLKEIANKKKWLHVLDDARDNDPFSEPTPSPLDTKEQILQDYEEKLRDRNEEIAKLKQMIEQLEQKQTQQKPAPKKINLTKLLKNHDEVIANVEAVLKDTELCLSRNKPLRKRIVDPFEEDDKEEHYECDEEMLFNIVSEFNN